MRDAWAIRDDERRSWEGVCFEKPLDRLCILPTKGDARDVGAALRHGFEAEILLRRGLAGRRESRAGAERRRFRLLTARIGVSASPEA